MCIEDVDSWFQNDDLPFASQIIIIIIVYFSSSLTEWDRFEETL